MEKPVFVSIMLVKFSMYTNEMFLVAGKVCVAGVGEKGGIIPGSLIVKKRYSGPLRKKGQEVNNCFASS